jgi:hypothetical protein
MVENPKQSGEFTRFVATVIFYIGFACLAVIPFIVYGCIAKVGEKNTFFLLGVSALFCFLFLIIFILCTLFSMGLYLISYRLANGSRALPDFGRSGNAGERGISIQNLLEEAIVITQKTKTFRLLYKLVSHFFLALRRKLEKDRFIEYLGSDDYQRNRIGIYAYDCLRYPGLKRPAERLLLRLAKRYPNHDDPDHLIEIGKRASLSIS